MQAVDHKLVTWDITSTLLTFNPATATEGDPVKLTADVTDQGLDALASAFPAAGHGDLLHRRHSDFRRVRQRCGDRPSDGPDNIATCSYTPTTSGSVTITAAYSGDDYALPSSDQENLTVNP